jgi:hypothetical protein
MHLSKRAEMVSNVAGRGKIQTALALAVIAVAGGRASAVTFTPGDLVVNSYASTESVADGAPSPITLLEYSTSGGAAVLSDTLPTTNGVGGSSNLGVVGEYGSASEGNIQLSGNGQYLTFDAYSASAAALGVGATTKSENGSSVAVGTPYQKSGSISLAQSADTDVPRVAVLVGNNGSVNSTTELNDLYNLNNPRSLYSANGAAGSSFYISGQGDGSDSDQGVFNGTIGMNTVTTPSVTPTPIYDSSQTRFVTGFNNTIYYSIDTSSHTGVMSLGTNPTSLTTPTAITAATNAKTGSSEVFYSPEGFFFANSTTLYVADTGVPKAFVSGASADGGIQKWTLSSGTWSLDYTLTPTGGDWLNASDSATASSGETGFAAITGEVVGNSVELFAVSYTAGDDNPNGLYGITDSLSATSGSGESFTELESATGSGGQTFKGVSFAPTAVPEPTTLSLLAGGAALALRRRRRNA